MHSRKKVLVFVDWYEPGFKAGGPIRSIVNFATGLQSYLEIFIVTGDRDAGDKQPYPGQVSDQWLSKEKYSVYYSSPRSLTFSKIKQIISAVNPDWIYLNSMFSIPYSLFPVLAGLRLKKKTPILLAPRGMLKPSALRYKKWKKAAFLSMYRITRIPRRLIFHGTSADEITDIRSVFGNDVRTVLMPNLAAAQKQFVPVLDKLTGRLKIIFVGRIHPIKGLHYLLETLISIQSNVHLTIVGEIDNADYWKNCQKTIRSFPDNIKVSALHGIAHSMIEAMILSHHLFVLPTQGENFGHAIFESLALGRPVLISDQTPWKNLEVSEAGWDLSLVDADAFRKVIVQVADMDLSELNTWAFGSWQYCSRFIADSNDVQRYREFFES